MWIYHFKIKNENDIICSVILNVLKSSWILSQLYIHVYWFPQTTLPEFRQPEFSVVRQHEEFVWLHDRYEENEDYAGIVVSSIYFYRYNEQCGCLGICSLSVKQISNNIIWLCPLWWSDTPCATSSRFWCFSGKATKTGRRRGDND